MRSSRPGGFLSFPRERIVGPRRNVRREKVGRHVSLRREPRQDNPIRQRNKQDDTRTSSLLHGLHGIGLHPYLCTFTLWSSDNALLHPVGVRPIPHVTGTASVMERQTGHDRALLRDDQPYTQGLLADSPDQAHLVPSVLDGVVEEVPHPEEENARFGSSIIGSIIIISSLGTVSRTTTPTPHPLYSS